MTAIAERPALNGVAFDSSANLKRLADCFPARDIEWRVGQCGVKKDGAVWAKVLAYVNNRAIMSRLDEVCGPGNWRNKFREWNAGKDGVLCGISLRIGGEWVTKWDGAENTDIEEVKGGLSSAMKRAAVQWGIGRYLYDLDEGWAIVSESGEHYAKTKDGKAFRWSPPPLPAWALPKGSPEPPHDSVEANRLPRGERVDARQANPRPAPTVYCTPEQKELIETLGKESNVAKDYWVEVMGHHKVKRLNLLTTQNAAQVVLDLSRRRVRQLMDICMWTLGDVKQVDGTVTADLPEHLDQEQANAALIALREYKARTEA